MQPIIIIPTYNERDNIIPLIKEIRNYVDSDILIIDDGSPDGTAKSVKKIQKESNSIYLIERPKKMGLGSAYLTGFQYAIENNYDIVFEMDADFSHNPKYLPEFLKEIKHNELVIGSRYVKGGGISNWSNWRRFISKAGNLYARMILMVPIKDFTGGYNCFRVATLKKFQLNKISSEGYSFLIEMKYLFYKNGFKTVEIPIVFEERREGQSKMSKKIFLEAIKQVWKFSFQKSKKMLKKEYQ